MGRYGEVKSVCLGKFKRPPQFIVYQQTRSHDMRGESITRFHSYCNMSLHNTDERRVHNTCEGPLHDIHRRARPICKHKNHPIIRAAPRKSACPASHAESSKLGHASIACKRPSSKHASITIYERARCKMCASTQSPRPSPPVMPPARRGNPRRGCCRSTASADRARSHPS